MGDVFITLELFLRQLFSNEPIPVVLILEQMTWAPAEFRRMQAYEPIVDGHKYLNKELYESAERRLTYVRQPNTM